MLDVNKIKIKFILEMTINYFVVVFLIFFLISNSPSNYKNNYEKTTHLDYKSFFYNIKKIHCSKAESNKLTDEAKCLIKYINDAEKTILLNKYSSKINVFIYENNLFTYHVNNKNVSQQEQQKEIKLILDNIKTNL